MITAASLVLLAMCSTVTGPAPDSAAAILKAREFRVRTLDSRVHSWLKTGAARSRTFSDLLDRLAASDLIVYIVVVDRIPGGVAGQLSFVAKKATVRYVRVELVSEGRPNDMISLLGHELQHAVEIADAPRVTDSQSLATLYLQIGGLRTEGSHYDSLAARMTGERVKTELTSSRSTALRANGDGFPHH